MSSFDLTLSSLGVRTWYKGLVTNYGEGGATKREGGGMRSFTPTKRGGGKSFSHSEGGGTKSFGVDFMR